VEAHVLLADFARADASGKVNAGRYEWRLQIDDEQRDGWRAPCLVRQTQQG
jgi:hypothetical protein